MSVKDQFDVRGLDTTLGYCSRAYQPAIEDGQIVKALKNLGAIIIAKTNLPQSIMVWATLAYLHQSSLIDIDSGARPRILSGA